MRKPTGHVKELLGYKDVSTTSQFAEFMLRNEVLTVGIVEQWNAGIMGSGKMETWVIVKFILTEN